jgi:tetratricopeptide (TPR) repeat protein
MLFDLKGKRKRLVQVTYVGLAFLFAIGLVGFGVGGGTNGGFLDAITGNGGGGGSSSSSDVLKRYERAVQVHPKSESAWLDLLRAEYAAATAGNDYDRNTGQFSEGAAPSLSRAAQAWEKYLALKPKRPDIGAANIIVQVYATLLRLGKGSPFDELKRAGEAQEIVAKRQPSAIAFYQLANISYVSGNFDKADRAGKKALALTPKDQRNTVKSQLDEARKQGLKLKKEAKSAREQATKAARDARKKGQDPFGASPVQPSTGQ